MTVVLETAPHALYFSITTTLILLGISLATGLAIKRIFFHPLSHIPGPLIARFTPLWLYYHSYNGDEATAIHALHIRHGPYVLVAPNSVDISDADAVHPIYVSGGGFRKASCYANFDIDGHPTIFSAVDPVYRTRRAKAVAAMFSTANLRANSAAIYACVDGMIERMRLEAKSGLPVNVLNLTRSLAVDIVSTHLFGTNYNGTEEKTHKLSVSGFVDAFVAVGRFFYLPVWLFGWLEWFAEKAVPDDARDSSMDIVNRFVDGLVNASCNGSTNFPGRLIGIGLTRSDVKAQCKDLIFAGTDSSGMNMATICRYLSMNPRWREAVKAELLNNVHDASTTKIDIQSLPYLSATVKECLRLSMANPTRLPHVVPASGWTFKSTYFPPGIDVGCSAFELHLNAAVFPSPTSFNPSRWITADAAARDNMNKHWIPFGAGSRACLARNLAMVELYMVTEKLVESCVLEGARACQDKVEIYEWFNSCVKGEKVELAWNSNCVKL